MAPRLFFGQGGGNNLYRSDDTAADDAGAGFDMLATTNRVAPAGAGGEAIFTVLWLALTYTMAVTVRVTPYVDGVALDSQQIALAAQAERTTKRWKVGLSVPLFDALLNEVARFAPRGVWFQAKVESTGGLATGDLIVEGVEIEHEVVRASQKAEALP